MRNFLTKEQKKIMKDNDLIMIPKEQLEKFKHLKYKNQIEYLVNDICYVLFSKFKEKIKTYLKPELDDVEKIINDEIRYHIEAFMEVVYDYVPTHKRTWSGEILRKKTVEAIRRYRFFELIFIHDNGTKEYLDYNIYMNRKKLEKALRVLNNKKNPGRYIGKERKIV